MKLIFMVLFVLGHIDAKPLIRSPDHPTPARGHELDHSPLIGFDCNQTEPEIVTISALDVGPCPTYSNLTAKTHEQFGQILQKRSYDRIEVKTCQLIESTFYFRCGGNWINYNVYPPMIGHVVKIPPADCEKAHTQGRFKWAEGHTEWYELEVNKTYEFSVNKIGWTDKKGYCEGGSYTIGGQIHDNVVVQSSYMFSLRSSFSQVDIDSGVLNIENQISCPYLHGKCHDYKTGTHVWVSSPYKCDGTKYHVLYQGKINITTGAPPNDVSLITINRPPFLFTSEQGSGTSLCAGSGFLTEYPDIFFAPQVDGNFQYPNVPSTQEDTQVITYLNAKLTFTYYSLYENAQALYYKNILETCRVEREVLKNRIEIIRLNSNAGGLSTLINDGVFAKTNGEVIHLIRCQPTPVTFRRTVKCYDSLPIIYGNQMGFLMPKSHIISPTSTEIECSPITPLTYMIGNSWWAYNKDFYPVNNPSLLLPVTNFDLPFKRIRSFAKGGMYPEEQVMAIQKLLTFPAYRDSITSDIISGLRQGHYGSGKYDLTQIMNEQSWKEIAKRNIKEYWGYFSEFGSFFSGVFGIYIIYRLFKGVFSTIIDLRDLYRVFGWSFRLLAALWGRLAASLLRRAYAADPVPEQDPDEDPEPTQAIALATSSAWDPIYPTCPKEPEQADTRV